MGVCREAAVLGFIIRRAVAEREKGQRRTARVPRYGGRVRPAWTGAAVASLAAVAVAASAAAAVTRPGARPWIAAGQLFRG